MEESEKERVREPPDSVPALSKSPEELYRMWRMVRHQPAWLSFMYERHGLTTEDEVFLNDLDSEWTERAKSYESECRKEVAQKVAEFRREVAQDQHKWVMERRQEYLEQEAKILDDRIRQAYADHDAEAAKGGPLVNRLLILECSGVQEMEMRVKRIRAELRALKWPDNGRKRLTDEQIQRARSRPLESVLEDDPVRGFIRCPVHEERVGHPDTHPSMLVKAGFGHCFSCGGHMDAIGYLMKIRNLSFQKAVEVLQ